MSKFYVYLMNSDIKKEQIFNISDDRKLLSVKRTHYIATNCLIDKVYHPHYLFTDDNSSSEVFNQIFEGIIEGAIEGIDAVVIACGLACSSKTHKIIGSFHDKLIQGFLMNFVDRLFETIIKYKETCNISLEISCIEIKNDIFYDLLKYPVERKFSIQKMSKLKINSPEEAVKILSKACYRRSTTLKNSYQANDSNLIFTIHMSTINYSKFNDKKYTAKVHIIDTMSVGDIPPNVDAKLTLLSLEIFFLRLSSWKAKKKSIYSKKFNTKLPSVLRCCGKSIFFGNNIRLLCHIRSDEQQVTTIRSILQLGETVASLGISNPIINSIQDPNVYLNNLQTTVNNLKNELILINMLNEWKNNNLVSNNFSVQYPLYNIAEQFFLKNKPIPIEIVCKTPTALLLSIFREQYRYLSKTSTERKIWLKIPSMTNMTRNEIKQSVNFNMDIFHLRIEEIYKLVESVLNDDIYIAIDLQSMESFKRYEFEFNDYKKLKLSLKNALTSLKEIVDAFISNQQMVNKTYEDIKFEREKRYSSKENYSNEAGIIIVGEREKYFLKQFEFFTNVMKEQKPKLLESKNYVTKLLIQTEILKKKLDSKILSNYNEKF